MTTTATPRKPVGRKPNPKTLEAIELHSQGLHARAISELTGLSIGKVYSALHNRGLKCHYGPDYMRTYPAEFNTELMKAVDARVLSGEIDRRAKAYRIFDNGGTVEEAAFETGGTLAEMEAFKSEMPANWTAMGAG